MAGFDGQNHYRITRFIWFLWKETRYDLKLRPSPPHLLRWHRIYHCLLFSVQVFIIFQFTKCCLFISIFFFNLPNAHASTVAQPKDIISLGAWRQARNWQWGGNSANKRVRQSLSQTFQNLSKSFANVICFKHMVFRGYEVHSDPYMHS